MVDFILFLLIFRKLTEISVIKTGFASTHHSNLELVAVLTHRIFNNFEV